MITARALCKSFIFAAPLPRCDLLPVELGQLFGNLCFQRFNRIFLVFQVMLDALPVDLLKRFFGPGQRFAGLLFLEGFPS